MSAPAVERSAGPRSGTERLARAGHIAFFDVDETVLAAKSMLDFWSYWTLESEPGGFLGGEGHPGRVARALPAGADRAERNRAYYRRFAGVPLARLQRAGEQWYAAYRRNRAAFVTAGIAALDRHRDAGHGVVLVSGSTHALLDPLARDVGADLVLCTEQITGPDGVLTGEVRRPMIGEAKARAVASLLARLHLPAEDCSGYGDHASDLAMLRAVGRPAVVGGDPDLLARARHHGWPVLSAAAGPRTARSAAVP
ncbi:HAD-IB family hydrolase [Streptomyces sp. SCA3-4]|uniref:HAD family hydrolase n=1 Tax=Streptomyces sichuanensis TaxID=2871810 RepID=UPI001CE316E5|nr:HAD-IB family hydrolase [Streptomyces sichuanensis]MCA6094907.1 HAD-IB family hydrolase [Streptomyces sichuanensis]